MHWFFYFSLFHSIFLIEALVGKNLKHAKDYEYPFIASIAHKNPVRPAERNHFCMGTLISDKHILTCAHCFEGELPEGIQVLIGSGNLLTSQSYDVATWITFDTWAAARNRSSVYEDNDVAMLLLSKPVYNAKMKPIKLARSKVDEIDGTRAVIAGFGVTNNGTRSSQLMSGGVTVLSRDRCNKRMSAVSGDRIEIFDTDFCSKADPFVLGSNGDSGGPVLNTNNELLGLHLGICPRHTAYRCPTDKEFLQKHQTNVHLSVDFYRDFIRYFR